MSPPPSSSSGSPLHALQTSLRPPASPQREKHRLLVAGATGVLGNEVLRRLVGSGRFVHTEVLASEPMTSGLPAVGIALAGASSIEHWAARPVPAQTGVIMFEPPRLYYGRERTLWTPMPEQLPALARWLKSCGVQTLVVVMPHAPGRLPEALKRGLANLDEQAVVALGFERMLLVRSARKTDSPAASGFLEKTAGWMLSTLKYMIPATEQPVRPAKLAEFVDTALRVLPLGTHVAAPELLWQAGQSHSAGPANNMHSLVQAWLDAGRNPKQNPKQNSQADSPRPFAD